MSNHMIDLFQFLAFSMIVPIKELEFSFSRSSGAGGQNVNKVNSKVTLRWNMKKSKAVSEAVKKRFVEQYPRFVIEGEIVQITSQRFRTQAKNIADCTDKLNDLLSSVARPKKRRVATKPTRASVEKRIKSKRSKSETKKNRKKVDY